jgi:hypothetical protein
VVTDLDEVEILVHALMGGCVPGGFTDTGGLMINGMAILICGGVAGSALTTTRPSVVVPELSVMMTLTAFPAALRAERTISVQMEGVSNSGDG